MVYERGHYASVPYAAFGSGPPLLVIAGLLPTSGVSSDSTVRAAAPGVGRLRRARRVVVTNRRPGLPRGLTMDDLAAEYAAAAQAIGVGPVDVLGMSTGGSIAQQLAACHPELVRRLVLVSTACRLSPATRRSQARLAAALRAGGRPAVARAAAPRLSRIPGLRGLAREVAMRVIPTDADADSFAATIEAEDAFDLRACPPITSPTLLVVAAHDRFYPAELFDETVSLIARCELLTVARRGHASALLSSRAIRDIVTFLD